MTTRSEHFSSPDCLEVREKHGATSALWLGHLVGDSVYWVPGTCSEPKSIGQHGSLHGTAGQFHADRCDVNTDPDSARDRRRFTRTRQSKADADGLASEGLRYRWVGETRALPDADPPAVESSMKIDADQLTFYATEDGRHPLAISSATVDAAGDVRLAFESGTAPCAPGDEGEYRFVLSPTQDPWRSRSSAIPANSGLRPFLVHGRDQRVRPITCALVISTRGITYLSYTRRWSALRIGITTTAGSATRFRMAGRIPRTTRTAMSWCRSTRQTEPVSTFFRTSWPTSRRTMRDPQVRQRARNGRGLVRRSHSRLDQVTPRSSSDPRSIGRSRWPAGLFDGPLG